MAHDSELPMPEDLAAIPEDGGNDYNRLIFEKSPYLLQHATNPVDWYPWGKAAFDCALAQNRPIFLSIGYATCHWCHVMAHESFEDPEVARLMNENFVAVKVDKEERPDIDDIYMAACLMMNGHGGWPLTVLLAPDQQAFFAATYLPKSSSGGRMGMLDFVPRIANLWRSRQEALLEDAKRLTAAIEQYGKSEKGGRAETALIRKGYEQLTANYDPDHGGFGGAPKFPTGHHYLFLLMASAQPWGDRALAITQHSLLAMRCGGIFDHVGLGFHRYSTDAEWLLPHFEKMLYDQALLAMAYLQAYQATGNPSLGQTAREIFTYVLRDLTDPHGGFYSAEDADSEGEEGKFYVWHAEELHTSLADAKTFTKTYQVHTDGNFHDEATGQATGANILHLAFSQGHHPHVEVDGQLLRPHETICQMLFDMRVKRIHPLKDDKILTDWNGLMIAAFAMGHRILGETTYLDAAGKAAQFLGDTLTDASGKLVKRYRDGEAGLPAHLDDYAFTIWGMLELYRASMDPLYLKRALALTELAQQQFLDPESGAFFMTAGEGEPLIVRSMKAHDGALPSGNSVMAYVMARLGRLVGRVDLEHASRGIINAFAGQLGGNPSSSTFMLMALDFLDNQTQEIVIVGSQNSDQTRSFLKAVQSKFRPYTSLLLKNPEDETLPQIVPFVAEMCMVDGAVTAYVCQNQACGLPITDLPDLVQKLGEGIA